MRAIHPVHNLVLLQYDPACIGDTPVKSCKFSEASVKHGEKKRAWKVGVAGNNRSGTYLASSKGEINGTTNLTSHPLGLNVDLYNFSGASSGSQDGVLADAEGNVLALWSQSVTTFMKRTLRCP